MRYCGLAWTYKTFMQLCLRGQKQRFCFFSPSRRVGRNVPPSSWEADVCDHSLSLLYRRLCGCSTAVQFAQLVYAALRERPHLQGVLPVSPRVLRHCYALGLHSNGTNAALALRIAGHHFSLIPGYHLLLESREALDLEYAHLHGKVGDWSKALMIVKGSCAIRMSVKDDFARYVEQISLMRNTVAPSCKDVSHSVLPRPTDIARAVEGAQPWRSALEILRATCNTQAVADATNVVAFVSRNDCVDRLSWQERLAIFSALPPLQQSFRALRPLLEASPQRHPLFIVAASKALRACASRMYAGKVTQRVSFLHRQGRWEFAIALCCAAGYYDVALPLTSFLDKRLDDRTACFKSDGNKAECVFPSELHLFANTIARLGHATGSICTAKTSSSMTPTVGAINYAALSIPELLAHALYGDWRRVATEGATRVLTNARLRSLLSAKLRHEDGDDGLGEVQCFTFQSSKESRLVCESADSRARSYFLRVIPRYLHTHHCSVAILASTVSRQRLAAERVSSYIETYHQTNTTVVRTKEDCRTMMAAITFYLRHTACGAEGTSCATPARRRVGTVVTEEALLRELARVLAHGHVVQLMPSDRYSLALELLRAGNQLGLRLDACVVVSLVDTSVPALLLESCTPALAAAVDALNLLGFWRRALQLGYAHFRRRNGVASGATDKAAPQNYPRHDHDTDNLHEHLAQVAFYAPLPTARKLIRVLLRHQDAAGQPPRRPFARILADLMHHDTRELRGRLRRLTADAARNGVGDTIRRDGAARMRDQERRALLGAAFCLLNEQTALKSVVSAAAKTRIGAEDVDEHGMQRLTRVLAWHDALAALEQLWVAGETVESHWLALLIARAASPSCVVAGWRVTRWRPYSSQINCLALCREAIAEGDAALAVKALVRYCYLNGYLAQPCFLLPLLLLLRHFCESKAVVRSLRNFSSSGTAGRSAETTPDRSGQHRPRQSAAMWMRQLYNRLMQEPTLTPLLKPHRHWIALSLHRPPAADTVSQPVAAVLIAGHLHHILARHLQWPVAASLSSRLLQLASTYGSDWKSAFYMFSALRRPTLAERALLVVALRECDMAAAVLTGNRRFLHAVPEQVVVWTHDALGKDKWQVSLRLLQAAHARLEPPTTHSEVVSDTCTAPLPGQSANVLDEVRAMVSSWTAADCTRALVLLRRAGFTPERTAPMAACDRAEKHTRAVIDILLTQEHRCAEREL